MIEFGHGKFVMVLCSWGTELSASTASAKVRAMASSPELVEESRITKIGGLSSAWPPSHLLCRMLHWQLITVREIRTGLLAEGTVRASRQHSISTPRRRQQAYTAGFTVFLGVILLPNTNPISPTARN